MKEPIDVMVRKAHTLVFDAAPTLQRRSRLWRIIAELAVRAEKAEASKSRIAERLHKAVDDTIRVA